MIATGPVLVLCALFCVVGINLGYCLRISHVDYCVRRAKATGRFAETKLVDGRVMIVVTPEDKV